MPRFSVLAASAVALVVSASAQTSPQALNAEKIPGAIKHAGIYHVFTGTWTRSGGAAANFGPDTIYSNTAQSGYYSSAGGNGGFAPGSENFDEGNLPSSANTNNAGNRDSYNVNCVEIGYCDLDAAGVSGWELSFYTSHVPCTLNTAPNGTFDTGALPANGCWTVAFDLSGVEICLGADGGDGFDDDDALDSFGWSYRYTGTGAANAGFFLTADPQSTDPTWIIGGLPEDGTNTYFGPASLCSPDEATGLKTADLWWLEDPNDPDPGGPNATSNCYWFGGYSNNNGCGGPSNPYASWYLELQADTTSPGPTTTCASVPIGMQNGCASTANSTGANTKMNLRGSTSVSANDVTCVANLPINTIGFFITAETPGFLPMPGGSSGNLCLNPAGIGRFSNLAANSGASGIIEISTTAGQWSLSSIPRGSGPYAAVAGGSAHFQLWHRDTSPAGPTSNFSDGYVVTWTP